MEKDKIKNELIKIVGQENVFTEKAQRLCYRFGNVVEYRLAPPTFFADYVVKPLTTEQVSSILKLANKYEIPVVPWGGGTDFTGANSPIKNGIVLDMKALNDIKINTEEQSITVGAGSTLLRITEEAEKNGFLFQHELTIQPSATIGGAISTNSFGYRTGKYRSIRNLILGIEAVLPSGDIIKTKPLFKTSTGYDPISLLVGSEGTLGIITEVTLKLVPMPESRKIISYIFDSFETGFKAIKDIQNTIIPDFFVLTELSFLKYSEFPAEFIAKNLNSRLISEYVQLKYIRKSTSAELLEKILSNLPYANQIIRYIDNTLEGEGCLTLLIIGFEGEKTIVKRKVKVIDKIAKSFGGFKFKDTSEYKKQFSSHLERFREIIFDQFPEYSQSFRIATFDISSLPSKVVSVKEILHKLVKNYENIKLVDIELFSSLVNINFEVIFPSNEGDSYFKFFEELNVEILKLGCSLSFAHGIGTRFLPYLRADIGEEQLIVMNKIKRALDPKNILNPGKIGDFK
jgi:glycolate oxidase